MIKVKNADSILVVGAGFVGVEVMGTIADAYPDKKLGLISSSETILPGYNMKS
jgi:NADH dehydrogenase FAD-containing subunit